ncbi:MAG: hypothetical protein BMS9Abin05_2374 [Rhodothermia bacterium]|nr:MAG: hypothetical protein BMS9Abin05_2374 [Rhodothermia bacterium]
MTVHAADKGASPETRGGRVKSKPLLTALSKDQLEIERLPA